jgi:hypothetical protein
MADAEKVAARLALLADVSLSQDDLQSITAEIEDLDRVVAELEEFGQNTPWIAAQVQPADKKA